MLLFVNIYLFQHVSNSLKNTFVFLKSILLYCWSKTQQINFLIMKKLSLSAIKATKLSDKLINDEKTSKGGASFSVAAATGGLMADCHIEPIELPPIEHPCDRGSGNCGSMSGW